MSQQVSQQLSPALKCQRPYAQSKAQMFYGWKDLTGLHRALTSGMNRYTACEPGFAAQHQYFFFWAEQQQILSTSLSNLKENLPRSVTAKQHLPKICGFWNQIFHNDTCVMLRCFVVYMHVHTHIKPILGAHLKSSALLRDCTLPPAFFLDDVSQDYLCSVRGEHTHIWGDDEIISHTLLSLRASTVIWHTSTPWKPD